MKNFLLVVFLLIGVVKSHYLSACNHKVFAPTTYYSRQDGVFETNIWSTTSHVGASCGCNPGCNVPANSTIYIAHIVTSSCTELQLGSNVKLIITGTGSFTLTGDGSITGAGGLEVQAGGLMTVNGNIELNGSGSIEIDGTLNIFGSINDLNGGISICGAGNINLTGSNNATLCNTPGNTPVLPVTFTKFYVKQRDNIEELFWQTASEQNNRVFEVERSLDGLGFEKIGEHKSKADNQGNSNSILDYIYEDANPINGFSYYRLKQVDFNNQFKYSSIVSVNFESSKNVSFVIFPNPNKGEFAVDFKGIENNHEISISLVDMSGKIVFNTIVYPENILNNSFKITPDVDLPAGKYIVRLKIEGVSHTIKMLVE